WATSRPTASTDGARSRSRSRSAARRRTPARGTTRAAERRFGLLGADLRAGGLHGRDQLGLARLALHLLGCFLEPRIRRTGLDQVVEVGKRLARGRAQAPEPVDDRLA